MAIKRLAWLRSRKKTEPEPPVRLPIACGSMSNGEVWWPDTPRKKLIRKLVLEKADEISRKEGIDRREFLASSCGMATTLYMINLVNGCSNEKPTSNVILQGGTGGSSPSIGGGGGVGGAAGQVVVPTGGSTPPPGGGMGGTPPVGGSSGSPGGGSGGAGGFSGMGGDAMCDPAVANEALGIGGDELVIDMQSHFANTNTNPIGALLLQGFIGQITQARFPWMQRSFTEAQCAASAGICYDQVEYVEQLMKGSDTTIGVLSGISYALGADGTGDMGSVLNNEDLLDGAMTLEAMFPNRILTHAMVMPNDRIDVQLAMMDRTASTYSNWKTYPPWGPNATTNPGYWLDGEGDMNAPGPRMIQKGIELGSPIFCIHKGFPLTSFSPVYTNPKDVGPAANMFPMAHLVIYHSAFEHGLASGGTTEPGDPATAQSLVCGPMAVQRAGGMFPEGPYDESNAMLVGRGVNSLIKSLRDANIGPNGTRLDPSSKEVMAGTENSTHVYSECGGTWPNLMTGRVDEAMHYWGKLLKHIGEDRIVWGTDCLWFGSPQPVIEAFRCFEISEQFQMMYGYPALTPLRKAKILGLNARNLQNVRRPSNPIRACRHSDIAPASARLLRRELDEEFGRRRDMMQHVWGPRTRREFLALRRHELLEKSFWSGRSPSRGWNGKV